MRCLVIGASGYVRRGEDVEVIYYLVHSLSRRDFEDTDRVAAERVSNAAAEAG